MALIPDNTPTAPDYLAPHPMLSPERAPLKRVCLRHDTDANFRLRDFIYKEVLFVTDKNQLLLADGKTPYSQLQEVDSIVTLLFNTYYTARRDTTEQWAKNNPVLLEGELGIDTESLEVRCGNGTSQWLYLQPIQFKFSVAHFTPKK